MIVFDEERSSLILAKDSAEARGDAVGVTDRFVEEEVSEIWENDNGKLDASSGAIV